MPRLLSFGLYFRSKCFFCVQNIVVYKGKSQFPEKKMIFFSICGKDIHLIRLSYIFLLRARKKGENMKKLILASGSPRRKELLELADVPFEIVVSEIEETIGAYSSPSDIVMSLALQKASAVAENHEDGIVLGADTIVTYESRILGKPSDEAEAKEMLQLLSGKTHEVYTGVALISKEKTVTFYERTEVTFWELTEEEIDTYIGTKEPLDKAGSYGIQGKGSIFVHHIQGDYYSVVGLPIARLIRELKQFDSDASHA